MKYFFLFVLLASCSETNDSYFPLDKIKSWSYKIEIQPEVEKKTIYKKVNLSLGKKLLEINGTKSILYPFLREDGSIFYKKKIVESTETASLLLKIIKLTLKKKKEWFYPFPMKKVKNGQLKVKLF